jgi:very-short-patch-repair endonuclease
MKRIDLDIDDLIRRYEDGDSVLAMSRDLGVSRTVVVNNLHRIALAPRTSKQAGRLRAARLSPAQRKAQAEAAHIAKRGCPNTHEQLARMAATRQLRCLTVSPHENILRDLLSERGVETVQQQAIGSYNCDLAAFPVAVEVFGGNWHWYGNHLAAIAKRFNYILNAGWHILVVWTNNEFCITSETADYVAAYIKTARSNPSARREYRVIRRAGQTIASGGADGDKISIISAFANARNALGQYVSVPR